MFTKKQTAKNQNIFNPSVRKRKAYYTAAVVFFSYFSLYLKSKLFGKKYYQKRLNQKHLKNAERIKIRIQELQGLFIKFGQLISNMSNVLPEEFRAPLEELQDHIKAKPYSEIEQTIEAELGDKPDKLFAHFNKEPLAAASIGQVHKASLNGESIIVKIQHKNIETIAKADLSILKNLVKFHAFFMDMQGLDHTYNQVKQMIEEELDYAKEAKAMQQIANSIEQVPELRVKIPKIYSQFSTSKILTAEFCEGTNIGQIKELQSFDLDLEGISKRLIELYCKMILIDGFYHADPHPGNILVNKQGEIILLDFGAVAHLSERTKQAIPELIEAVIKNDAEEITLALKKMGFLGSDKASRKYVKKLIEMFKEFLQNEVQFDGLNFQNIKLNSGLSSLTDMIQKVDLREVSNTIKIPKDYILLNRTIVLLIGNAFRLAPDLNALTVVRPYIQQHILNKEYGFAQMIVKTLKSQVTTAISLPNELTQFLKDTKETDLELEIQGVKQNLQKIYYLGQQILFSFLLMALCFFSESLNLNAFLYKGLLLLLGFLLARAFYYDFKIKGTGN